MQNKLFVTPQTDRVQSNSVLSDVVNRTNINQIRGINQSGAVGSGIPKHVTNVSAIVSDASVGSTSKVVLTFQRDSTDKTFSGVTVFARGYQGNHSPTQVGFGTDAPITLIFKQHRGIG